jgi:hypothetical protein
MAPESYRGEESLRKSKILEPMGGLLMWPQTVIKLHLGPLPYSRYAAAVTAT